MSDIANGEVSITPALATYTCVSSYFYIPANQDSTLRCRLVSCLTGDLAILVLKLNSTAYHACVHRVAMEKRLRDGVAIESGENKETIVPRRMNGLINTVRGI